eukprot:7382366-Prymnesium_polylepis.3
MPKSLKSAAIGSGDGAAPSSSARVAPATIGCDWGSSPTAGRSVVIFGTCAARSGNSRSASTALETGGPG